MIFFQIRQGFVLRQVAGEYLAIPIMMDVKIRTKMVLLNDVSDFLWKLLEEKQTIDDLVRKISEEFDVTPEEALADIKLFLEELEEQELLIKEMEE